MAVAIFCNLFLLIISISGANSAQLCGSCAHQSDASHFSTPSAYSSGACGYGPLAIGFNHGHLASVAPSLYKNGAACGACFQTRADQDSRSDVDQDLPVDQTRKNDDEASDDSCSRPTLTLKEEVEDVDDPFGKIERNAQENITKRINNVKKEGNDVRGRRRRSFKTKKYAGRSRRDGNSSNLLNAETVRQFVLFSSPLVNEFFKIKTFELTAGSGSGSGEGGNNKGNSSKAP